MISRIYSTLFLVLFIGSTIAAQEARPERSKEKRTERLEQQKIAYLSTKLNLTTEQAQRFWPIYNKHEAIRKSQGDRFRKRDENRAALSEAEAGDLISEFLEMEQKRVEDRTNYINDLKGVLSNKQIVTLVESERNFRRDIFDQYKKRKSVEVYEFKRGDKGKNRGKNMP
jgi:Spy/CpxP family protein refolding chaperone